MTLLAIGNTKLWNWSKLPSRLRRVLAWDYQEQLSGCFDWSDIDAGGGVVLLAARLRP